MFFEDCKTFFSGAAVRKLHFEAIFAWNNVIKVTFKKNSHGFYIKMCW